MVIPNSSMAADGSGTVDKTTPFELLLLVPAPKFVRQSEYWYGPESPPALRQTTKSAASTLLLRLKSPDRSSLTTPR